MSARSRRSAAAIFALVAVVACGGGKKVGDESLLNFKDQVRPRIGQQQSPTASPSARPGATPSKKSAIGNTQTQRPSTKAPTTTFDIAINSDTASKPGFDPLVVRVYAGTIVRWTNRDTVARSVEADGGAFRSPSIAPGRTFSWTANKVGKFNYHDGTRPYTVASVEVIAR